MSSAGIDSSISIYGNSQPSFSAFIADRRTLLLVCSAAFIAIYLLVIFSFDVHFFYCMLARDPLLYYLHGWYLLHLHTFNARLADNLPPFHYIGLPGYLRIPLIAATPDFGLQLRLIQISNLLLLCFIGWINTYLISLCLPVKWQDLAFPYLFAMPLICTSWEFNVFLPLSDCFFAASFCGALIAIRQAGDSPPERRLRWNWFWILALSTLAAAIKFLGFLLPIYALLYLWPRLKSESRRILLFTMGLFGLLIIVVALSLHSTIFAYASIWIARIHTTRWCDWLLNLLLISIPGQVFPPFINLYTPRLTTGMIVFNWFVCKQDILVAALGAAITLFSILGAIRLWKRVRAELILLLMFLPVVAPITTSTSRYLLPLQFLILACAIEGVAGAFQKLVGIGISRNAWVFRAVAATLLLASALVHGWGAASHFSSRLASLHQVQSNVSSTYRQLDDFLSRLDPQKSRLLFYSGDQPTCGKWTVIRGLRYVAPDSSLYAVAQEKDLFLVIDHAQQWIWANNAQTESEVFSSLARWGAFKIEKVADMSNANAVGRVYRIIPAANLNPK